VKVVAENTDKTPKIGENFSTHKPQSGVENTLFLNGHHSPADRARELFKSGLNGERLVVRLKKKFFAVRFRPFWLCLQNHTLFWQVSLNNLWRQRPVGVR